MRSSTSFASGFYSYVWLATGILAILVPAVYRGIKVNDFRQEQQKYNWDQYWEQQNQQYEYQKEQQMQNYNSGDADNNNNNRNNYNWNNAGDYYADRYEQMRQTYDRNNCKWWQVNCYSYYMNANGEPEPEAGWYPSWFSGWSQTEEQRNDQMKFGQTSPAMRFVYVWQILTFLVILVYGFVVMRYNHPWLGFAIALGIYTNMCFLAMWWLADGSIVTETDYVQQVGFYGQLPVLMFMTNAAYVLFGIVHGGIFYWYGRDMMEEDKALEQQSEYELNTPSPSKKQNYIVPQVSPNEGDWTFIN